MDDRERYADRWRSAFRDWDKPLSLVWGMLDPLAVPAVLEGLRELRPDAEVTELPDVSHNPQIEVPGQVAAAIRAAVDRAQGGHVSREQIYGEKRRRLINSLRGRVTLAAAAVMGALWLAFAGRVEGGDDPVLKDEASKSSGGGTEHDHHRGADDTSHRGGVGRGEDDDGRGNHHRGGRAVHLDHGVIVILGADPGDHIFWLGSRAAGTAALVLASAAVLVGALRAGGLAGSEVRGGRRRLELAIVHEALGIAVMVAVAHPRNRAAGRRLPEAERGGHLDPLRLGLPAGSERHRHRVGVPVHRPRPHLLRARPDGRRPSGWRSTASTLLAWVGAFIHTLGMGTDRHDAWFLVVIFLPAVAALVVLVMRLASKPAAAAPAQRSRVVHEKPSAVRITVISSHAGDDPEPGPACRRRARRRADRGRVGHRGRRRRRDLHDQLGGADPDRIAVPGAGRLGDRCAR